MKKLIIIVLAVALFGICLVRTLLPVDEAEFVVVTQFGKPVKVIHEPGLHWKLPIQSKTSFDKRLLMYDLQPSEFLTQDKKNLIVDSYVFWKIREPIEFFKTVGDVLGAEMRLDDVVRSTLAATLGKYDLSALLSVKPGEMRLEEVALKVYDSSEMREASKNFGIEIVDVGIKRLNFPQQNKNSVFERMRAERSREAKRYRAEGNESALKIRAEADKEAVRIISEAYKQAEKTRGEGDAEATKIYADAYSRDPEFYKLVRTLEAYRKFLDDKTTIVLSSDSELLKILTDGVPSR